MVLDQDQLPPHTPAVLPTVKVPPLDTDWRAQWAPHSLWALYCRDCSAYLPLTQNKPQFLVALTSHRTATLYQLPVADRKY